MCEYLALKSTDGKGRIWATTPIPLSGMAVLTHAAGSKALVSSRAAPAVLQTHCPKGQVVLCWRCGLRLPRLGSVCAATGRHLSCTACSSARTGEQDEERQALGGCRRMWQGSYCFLQLSSVMAEKWCWALRSWAGPGERWCLQRCRLYMSSARFFVALQPTRNQPQQHLVCS